METVRKLTELDPRDLTVVERMFGQRLDTPGNFVLVLRATDTPADNSLDESDELPAWCNVLEGMSEQDRDEFRALLDLPVRLAHPE